MHSNEVRWFARPWCWGCAALLSIGNLFLHLPISDLCEVFLTRYGFPAYDRAALGVFGGISALAAAALLVRRGRTLMTRERIAALAGLLVLTLAAHRWLTVLNTELVHFPQFALLGGLLLFGGAPAPAAWLLTTAAGIADEIYQQYVIYAGRTDTYLDFNDMVLNTIGASWAILLLAGGPRKAGTARRTTAWIGVTLVLLFVATLQVSSQTEFWRYPMHGGRYHRLSAVEALLTATLLWLLVRTKSGAGGSPPRPR